jgi:DNA-binding NtrC family response regulator
MTIHERLAGIAEELVTANISRDETMRAFDRIYTIAALKANRGNACEAAKQLGVHRNSIHRLLPDLGQVRAWIKQQPRPARSEAQ